MNSSIEITIKAKQARSSSIILLCIALGLLSIAGAVLTFGLFKLFRYLWLTNSQHSGAKALQRRCEEVLKESPVGLYDSRVDKFTQTVCSICLMAFVEDCAVRVLACSHVFHRECIEQWIKEKITQKAKCPNCNVELVRDGMGRQDISIGIGNNESNQT